MTNNYGDGRNGERNALRVAEDAVARAKAARNELETRAQNGPLSDADKARLGSAKSDLETAERNLESVATRINAHTAADEARAALGIPDGIGPEQLEQRGNATIAALIEGRTDALNLSREKRSLVSTGATTGAATIPATIEAQFYEKLDSLSGLFAAAGKLETGLEEHPIKLPILSGWGTADAELAEGAQISEDDGEVTSVVFNAYRYTGIQNLSNTLNSSAGIDMQSMVATMLAQRLVRQYGAKLATGTGTDEPQGIVIGAGAAVTATAATAVTQAELVELVHSVSPEYRDSRTSAWVMHDTAWQQIRQLEDTQGRLLIGDLGNAAAQMLLGYPVIVDNYMPQMATGEAPIAFGNIETGFRVRHTDVRLDMSESYRFSHDELSFRSVIALDSKVVDQSAIVKITMG